MARPHPLAVICAATLLLLLAFGLLPTARGAANSPPEDGALLAVLSPPVTVTRSGDAAQPATPGEPLGPGDGVTTGAAGDAELGFADTSSLRLDAASQAHLDQPAAQPDGSTQPVAVLDQGISIAQAPLVSAAGFLLRTPGAEVRVLGARLRARVPRDPVTGAVIEEDIAVEVGTAEVHVGSQVVTLQSGQRLRILPSGPDGQPQLLVEQGTVLTSGESGVAGGALADSLPPAPPSEAQPEQPDHERGGGGGDGDAGGPGGKETPTPAPPPTASPTPSPIPNAHCPQAADNPRAVCWVGGSGDWCDPSHWSVDALPTSDDDVFITAGDVTVTHASGSDTVRTLHATGHLAISGGDFRVAGATEESEIDRFTLSSGALYLVGTLEVGQSFDWRGGRIVGGRDAGKLVIEPGASATLDGDTNKALGSTLENRGTLAWQAGSVQLGCCFTTPDFDSARIVNAAGAEFTIRSQAEYLSGPEELPGGIFTNAGMLLVEDDADVLIGGPFESSCDCSIQFNNGRLVVRSGIADISVGRFVSTGEITIAEESRLGIDSIQPDSLHVAIRHSRRR